LKEAKNFFENLNKEKDTLMEEAKKMAAIIVEKKCRKMAHVTKRVYPAKKKYTKKYFTDLKIKAEKKARLE